MACYERVSIYFSQTLYALIFQLGEKQTIVNSSLMIAFCFNSNLWRMGRGGGRQRGFLICLIHSRGKPFRDLLMKDVCIQLAAASDTAAPYRCSIRV